MKNFTLAIALFVAIFTFTSCGPTPSSQKKDGKDSVSSAGAEKKNTVKENWEYSQKVDKMDNKTTYYAECISTDVLQFEFPYNGGSTVTLVIRNMNNKNEILLTIDKGQFLTFDQRVYEKRKR